MTDYRIEEPASPAAAAQRSIMNIRAGIAIFFLIVIGYVGLSGYVPLYADGANYILQLLATKEFVHIAENRIFATFLTQTPVIVALNHYAPTPEEAIAIYSLSLFAVPVLAYGYALWLTRADPVAFTLTIAAICIGFLPTVFVIVGEFHVLYALAWLYAAIVLSQTRDTALNAFLLLAAAIVCIKSYEASAVIAPLLAVLTFFMLRSTRKVTEQAYLALLMVLLAIAAGVGIHGYLKPRDAGNAGGFVTSLFKIIEDSELLVIAAIVLSAAVASFIRNGIARAALAAATAWAAFQLLGREAASGYTDVLGLGSPNTQRAQVLPFHLLLIAGLFLNRLLGTGRRIAPQTWSFAPLLVPLVALTAVYITDVRRWNTFIVKACIELERPAGAAFYDDPSVKTYGWDWEMPTLSVLLRPKGSDRLLQYPGYAGWYPFDPATDVPDIAGYGRGTGICRSR